MKQSALDDAGEETTSVLLAAIRNGLGQEILKDGNNVDVAQLLDITDPAHIERISAGLNGYRGSAEDRTFSLVWYPGSKLLTIHTPAFLLPTK